MGETATTTTETTLEEKLVDQTITNLENRIRETSQKYYESGTSDISDSEWDALVDQLRVMNPDSPVLRTVGWGYNVESDTTPGDKIKHKYGVAGSLEKAYKLQDIKRSLIGRDIELSLKLDGISCVVYYKHGIMTYALTRGDGVTGIDISDKIRRIIPTTIKDKSFTGAVRGELLMTDKSFAYYSSQVSDVKNSRNTVAGLINANEISPYLKLVNLVVYTVVGDERPRLHYNIVDMANWLRQNFEYVVPSMEVKCFNAAVVNNMKFYQETLNRPYGYPVDGLVMKDYNLIFNSQPYAVDYSAQAWKFESENATTTVLDVEWNPTKTKYMMPRLITEPVELDGTTVQAATGYNAAYIFENNIGKGTVIRISKHGMIIPNVDEIITATGCSLPTHCPCCNSELQWDGVHLKCMNPDCSDAMLKDLLIWFENLVPKDGLSDKLRKKFLQMILDSNMVDDMSIDFIMECKAKFGNLDEVKNVKERDFYENWNDIHNLKNVPVKSALLALNVPRLGVKTAESFANNPKKTREFVKHIVDGYEDTAWSIASEITGKANVQSMKDNVSKIRHLKYIANAIVYGDETNNNNSAEVTTTTNTNSSSSKGRVAITGALSIPRKDFEKLLNQNGWELGELNSKTKFLITNDPNGNSSKNRKADELKVLKISEDAFTTRFLSPR